MTVVLKGSPGITRVGKTIIFNVSGKYRFSDLMCGFLKRFIFIILLVFFFVIYSLISFIPLKYAI